MNQKQKKDYEAPGLTVVSFKIERGFQASMMSMSFRAIETGQTLNESDYMEAQRTSYGWSESNNDSWF